MAVGLVEYSRRELFLNPKLISANMVESYFRVNSVFFDPNVYGRFLAVVMLAITAAMLWSTGRREVAAAAAALLVLWGGLMTSISQSSIAALLLGLAVLAALRFSVRRTLAVGVALVVAGAVFVLVDGSAIRVDLSSSKKADQATTGRYNLVRGGIDLFADRPLTGFGPGSFALEYRRRQRASTESAVSASHTIPITIAAEQGVAGLLLYLLILAAGAGRLFGSGVRDSPARMAVAAGFVALVLHTLLYADFLEDPITWTLLGIGTALAAADAGRRRRAPAAPRPGSPVLAYLKRLVSAGAAYQAGDLLAKVFAVFTLPLYTRHVSQAAYGVAETLLTSIILVSILLRMGVGEAFVRFHYDDDDPG
ncbi:MAG TPA: O-antigen ligase family protein, partial [Solirubrobacteraceae bacterium]|nr:O-antigen ligase family protein [Solirubrobacteraceae bacterium]